HLIDVVHLFARGGQILERRIGSRQRYVTEKCRGDRIDPSCRDPILREGHTTVGGRRVADWAEGREIAGTHGGRGHRERPRQRTPNPLPFVAGEKEGGVPDDRP